jgi:PAS domain S-box-containing protein
MGDNLPGSELRTGNVAVAPAEAPRNSLSWWALPQAARLYVVGVIAAGAYLMAAFFPLAYPHPALFAVLLLVSCLTSAWKVNLPLSLSSGSTLSVSYAADLTALLLLGPHHAMLVAVAGAWTQCTFKVQRPYPLYRTVFSLAAEAITIQATGLAYAALGGVLRPDSFGDLPKAMVGAIATYFLVNTGLVAGAIAFSTRQRPWRIWHHDFLWSAPSFMVAGSAGALAAVVLVRGGAWPAILLLAPVYLTYRTYLVFLGRIRDQQRHVEETGRLHSEAVEALLQARRAERALADEKERLAVTLRSIGDGIVTTDLDGTILLLNNVAEALTGWTQAQAIGRPLDAVFQSFDPETRERTDGSVARLTQDPQALGRGRCTVLVARDLTERPIEESTAMIRDATGRPIGIVLAFRDISDTLRIQEERAKAGKLESLGLLAGGIAHDFNNILMGILGNVALARVTMPPAGPAAGALAEAEQACLRARHLTWQLLTFSKGGVPAKKTTVLPEILKEAARLVLRGSNVQASFTIAPELLAVHADECQLVQVFSNILINAQQAMPHGGTIEIRAENAVETRKRWEYALRVEAGPYVRVSIADEGIGIPAEHLGRIFDPYFSTKQKGSGLGLATAHSIVKNHGGFLAVDSTLGRGTTVSVSLPAAFVRQAEESAAPARPASAGAFTARILVMDDEASIRTVAANMLEFLGYDAEVARDGAEAVARYKQARESGQPFDALILDLVVPDGMGGKETIEQLGAIDPAVTAILVTGYSQDRTVARFREYGFKAVVAKPFTLQELNRALRSVVVPRLPTVH